MIRYRSASPRWQRLRFGMVNPSKGGHLMDREESRHSSDQITANFQYVDLPMLHAAETFLATTPTPFIKRPAVQQIEALVRPYPGATVRLSGLSATGVHGCLEEPIAPGDVWQEGRGGAADPQGYYPMLTQTARHSSFKGSKTPMGSAGWFEGG